MAGENQEATDGYNGEVWLHNGAALYELQQVKSFGIPTPGERERAEVTHLKSPGRRREYIETFFADSEFEVVLNTRLLSDTDTLIDAAQNVGNEREMLLVFPQNGVPYAQVALTAKCTAYDRGTVENGEPMEATATFMIVTIGSITAYVEPANG